MTRSSSRLQLAVVSLVATMACQPPGEDRPHTALGPDAGELRTAFNADSGMVRVVMLVAPTDAPWLDANEFARHATELLGRH